MKNIYENRQYIIFNVSELDKIDFDTVLETSAETVRKSIDGNLTFIKWHGNMPECIANLESKVGPYNYNQMVDILNSYPWVPPVLDSV